MIIKYATSAPKSTRAIRAHVKRAVKKAGGYLALATRLGVTSWTIHRWVRGLGVPSEPYIDNLARLCGCKASDIRPHLFNIRYPLGLIRTSVLGEIDTTPKSG